MSTKLWYSNVTFSPAAEKKVVKEPVPAAYRDAEAIVSAYGADKREKAQKVFEIAFAVVLGCVAIYPIVRMLIG